MPHSEGLPPEINSHNVLNGPGISSMNRTKKQWNVLAWDMHYLDLSFRRILRRLADEWSGEAAEQVINAATPFQEWLADLAESFVSVQVRIGNIEQYFDWARQEVVDLASIDANRAQVLALTMDNDLGQNTATIPALEDEYDEYWDQDDEAMKRYRSGLSRELRQLQKTPWQQPPPIATDTGLVAPMPRAADGFGL
ncbi:PPE family protein [Mycobacterium haemophilum]|uniref:PPE domain-containing protein n=1 Tax=Mycobacterium haemophilum TaxID=29311 RepID=A0A0I9UCZ1_9MYCO|nr:PPE family protein [Mycobacterium haemophilum]KLO26777.1 hypothetical protein ABH39_17040 [Mycobacterium haemophilum]KLO38383.1 hypothetical protein ABH38_02870 [Mycobacterium haemophilum]KLO39388.1 hypothetical protein ABH37_18300 [Mycobacterium haemophilum]KLO46209.1 hypothetical protein ABH36_18540 [Mycobacterium haemophilum]